MPTVLLQAPQLQGPQQQLHGGPVDGLCDLPVHWLRGRGAPHLLRSQHLSAHRDHGKREHRYTSLSAQCTQ